MENDDKSIDERRFEAAVKVMRKLPEDGTFEPSDEMLALFYSYYKQATVGPCNTTKPNAWDSIGKAKWEAWKALGEMTKEQAMKEYIQEIQLILEMIPVTEEMVDLMDELDPFYEVVEDEDDDVNSNPATLAIEGGMSWDEEPENNAGWASSLEDEDEEDGVELEDSSEGGVGKDERVPPALCNGSAEVSSLTNDTHSSLNTEQEEEELACSTENSSQDPQDVYPCTDYISDEVPECEVSSDSVECATPQEGLGVSRGRLAGPEAFGARRLEDPRGSQDAKRQETLLPIPVAAGPVQSERDSVDRGRDEHHLGGSQIVDTVGKTLKGHEVPQCVEKTKHRVNTQITSALSRLQDDMQNVLQRLNTLEALTAAQDEAFPPEQDPHSASVKKRFPWWPQDTSPITVALALIWPFAVNWLVQIYLQRKRRSVFHQYLISSD
ncbi:acyl-CoA-binding domain-containing protein 5-B-like isoform X1 [Astyanax mexicanus]|uniref:Acyl-CoA-binding domain-containing protein 5-B-like isoform X1 n=1 Tax=Astyanax mexicanus TaxID=7994 RepID=A0A8T2LVR6_ASTMX|nr:acyl-CoA-binding domain-containing protein 5-B-like isoform X1 [Astyanax mexicanus]